MVGDGGVDVRGCDCSASSAGGAGGGRNGGGQVAVTGSACRGIAGCSGTGLEGAVAEPAGSGESCACYSGSLSGWCRRRGWWKWVGRWRW